ncbi:MAG: hypothetical protein IM638_05095 [Bacteroidetes bacterium]|nr:hypothetical protein [Bacteroidota bacterium]
MPFNSSLSLHFAQLNKAWQKSRYNKYSDREKQEYHNRLDELFVKIKDVDFTSLHNETIYIYKNAIDFLFKSIDFLDSSTLNLIPFETVECLSHALNDWKRNNDRFIIATNLVKNLSGYSFDPSLVRGDIYELIKHEFGVKFNAKLIQINVPVYLSRDYLASVVLYHELGHFINEHYQICTSILPEVIGLDFNQSRCRSLLERFFHFTPQRFEILIANTNSRSDRHGVLKGLIYSYLGEYFCDLFAIQYVGVSFPQYLDYIDSDTTPTLSHPSKERRIELMRAFLDPTDALQEALFFIEIFQKAIQKITGKKLQKAVTLIDSNSFYDLLPAQITSTNQLHGVFIQGWKCWEKNLKGSDIDSVANIKENAVLRYEIINNLIEKSIGNFIVERDWKNASL